GNLYPAMAHVQLYPPVQYQQQPQYSSYQPPSFRPDQQAPVPTPAEASSVPLLQPLLTPSDAMVPAPVAALPLAAPTPTPTPVPVDPANRITSKWVYLLLGVL